MRLNIYVIFLATLTLIQCTSDEYDYEILRGEWNVRYSYTQTKNGENIYNPRLMESTCVFNTDRSLILSPEFEGDIIRYWNILGEEAKMSITTKKTHGLTGDLYLHTQIYDILNFESDSILLDWTTISSDSIIRIRQWGFSK